MAEPGFSITTALGTPFRLVRQRPVMVLVWGLAMALFGIAAAALILPLLAGLPLTETIEDDSAALQAMMASIIQLQAVSVLLNLAQFGLTLVLWGAISRATLAEGQADKWFFMRLSMDEVWLLIVGFAVFIGLYAAMLVLMLFGLAIGFGVWGLGEPTNVIVIMAVGLACMAVLLIAMARVSLIAPACMIYGRLAFPEGWRLAKGQTGRLLLLMIAVWAVYTAVYVVLATVLIAVVIGSGGFANLDQATTPADILPSAGIIVAWIAAAILPVSAIGGFVLTLVVSPFVSACQQLVRLQADRQGLVATAP